jgi:hypothetical protein
MDGIQTLAMLQKASGSIIKHGPTKYHRQSFRLNMIDLKDCELFIFYTNI